MADDSNHETKKHKKKHHKKKHTRHDESQEDDTPEVKVLPKAEVDNSKAVKQPSTPKSPEIEKMAVKTTTTSHRDWTFDEEEQLLKEVEKFALSCNDENRKLVNWKLIEMEGFSQTEIHEEYKKLTKKVRKYRSVREIVIDAIQLHKNVEQTIHPGNLQNKVPAKPMNTFMLFCKAKRPSLVEKYPKLGFAEIHKKMCERWKELPDTKREKYAKKYEKDKKRYAEELEQYHETQLQGIKKPLSAYEMWKLEKDTDETNEHEIEEWDNLPKSMRKGWIQAATSEKERYKSEVSRITNKAPKRKRNNKFVHSIDASTSEEPGDNSKKKSEVPNDVDQNTSLKLEKSSPKRKLDTSNKSDESPPKKVMKPAKTESSESSTESD